jgi:alkylated DNA repair dioxygenase AlkB
LIGGVTVPGLHYVPSWLDESAQRNALASIDTSPWSSELRRRVQHYGHRYDYGKRASASGAPPIPAWASALAERLNAEGFMAEPADQVIINEYEPGQGISAHVDCVPCFGPAVAAVSLGSSCVMDFLGPGGERVGVSLGPGSLSVMTGPSRYTWKHAIAGRKSDPAPGGGRVPRGRRVSITFRTVITE